MSDQATFDAILRQDFGMFCRKVFQALNPTEQYLENWHLDAIMHDLGRAARGEEKRLIINLPPRSLKSILASVALPAFCLGHDPTTKIICVSYAQTLAAKFGRDFRKVVRSDWFERIFPDMQISKDSEDHIETTVGGYRFSTSIGGVVTGLGAGMIIIDDPLKPDEAPSAAARDRTNRFYRDTLFSRLNNKVEGTIILVAQRLHEEDLTAELLLDGDFKHQSFPAIATEREIVELGNGRKHIREVEDVLHPAREPREVLERIRLRSQSAFNAQYQQAPVPMTGNMVQRDWLRFYASVPRRDGMRITHSWDTAMVGDPRSDFTVCTVWGEYNGAHFLLDLYRKQLDFPDVIKAVADLHTRDQPDALLIEDVGSGTALIQQLRAMHGLHAIGRRSKLDKQTRLSVVLPMFEAGQVSIPDSSGWREDFLTELLGFPHTKHDDQVDSCSQYLGWAQDRNSSLFEIDWGNDEPVTDEDPPQNLWFPPFRR